MKPNTLKSSMKVKMTSVGVLTNVAIAFLKIRYPAYTDAWTQAAEAISLLTGAYVLAEAHVDASAATRPPVDVVTANATAQPAAEPQGAAHADA